MILHQKADAQDEQRERLYQEARKQAGICNIIMKIPPELFWGGVILVGLLIGVVV